MNEVESSRSATAVSTRGSRRIMFSVIGSLLTAIAVAAGVALSGVSVEAASYTLTSTTPTTNWSDVTRWNGGTGTTYPGQSPGDTATVNLSGTTINIDVAIANPVQLNISNFIPVTIPSGSSLVLEQSSSATSSNTITVNGGTLGVNSGANLSSWQGPITVNSGTFNVAGALAFSAGSSLTVNGGTIQGGGTLTIPSGHSATFQGSSGAMTLSNVVFDNFGTTSLNGPNTLAINSGAVLKIESGGNFNLQNDATINTDGVSSPRIAVLSGGNLSKSGGTLSTINAAVDNGGSVSPGGAAIYLAGGGTHGGSFALPATNSVVRFSGTHALNGGTSIASGAMGSFELTGGTMSVNTPLTVPSMKQTGGTLAGSAALTTSTGFEWAGGNQDGTTGGSTQTGTGTLKIDPVSAVQASGRAFSGSGAWTYNPGAGGSVSLLNNSQLNLSGGTFDLQSDTAINGDSASSINILGGTLTKSTGTKTTVAVPININGTGAIQPQGTTINFANGGSIGGTSVGVNTSVGGSLLEFSGGTTNLNGGATMTSGNFLLSGTGTLNINSPYPLTTYSQSGGTLKGTQTLTVGTLNWTGGVMDGGATGSGVLSVTSTANINGSATTEVRNHWTLVNGGTAHYAPSALLSVNAGGQISNSGTWNLENTTAITSDGSVDASNNKPQFINAGTISKTLAGSLSFGIPLTSSGAIILNNGADLELTGGGTISGGSLTFNNAADILGIQTNILTIGTAPTISGPGRIKVGSVGTLKVDAATTAPNLELGNGGTIDGAATLTISSAFKCTGGTMQGGGTTSIGPAATADLTGLVGALTLTSRTLTNGGTFNYNPTQALTFNGSATFNNNGTFNLGAPGSGSFAFSGTNAFNNAGQFNKTAGANVFTIGVPFTNSGTVSEQVSGGTLAFTGGGSSSGPMQGTVSGATIAFPSGSFAMASGSSFGSAGTVQVSGGTLNVNAALAAPAQFQLSSGTLGTSSGSLTFGSGTSGNFSGGTILQTPITASSGSSLTFDTTSTSLGIDASSISINAGATATWNGSNQILMSNGAAISDAGVFNWTGAGNIATSGTTPTISVSGALNKTSNAGMIGVAANLQNAGGTISSQAGTLQLNYNASSSQVGTFDASSGCSIDFGGNGGTNNFTNVIGSGSGNLRFLGGTATFTNSTALTNFYLGQGTINGPGPITFSGAFNWDGGNLNTPTTTGGGSLTLLGGLGAMTLNAALTSPTTTFSSPSNPFNIGAAITFTNSGTFNATSNGSISGTGTFANSGTFSKSGGVMTAISSAFNNSGTVNVATGRLKLLGGGSDSGAYTSSPGTFLELAGGTRSMTSAATLGNTVSGAVELTGANVTDGGTFTPAGTVSISGGSLTLNTTGTANIANGLTLSAGTLSGTSPLQLAGTSNVTGGTISGSGSLTVAGGASLIFNPTASTPVISGRTITNSGAITIPNTATFALEMDNGATINNQPGATFTMQNDAGIITGAGSASFLNAGILQKTGGTGAQPFSPALTNTGSLIASTAGTTNFLSTFTQSAGSTSLTGATLQNANGFNYGGGTLTGNGTLAGNLNNNGATIDPGTSTTAGALSVTGAYNQSAGALSTDLFGAGQFDALNVTGAATLAGTFSANLKNSYQPSNGSTFNVLTFGSRTGDFTQPYTLPTYAQGGAMSASYVSGPPQALQLAAVVTQTDLAVSQSAPTTVLHGQNAVITLTVSNNGPSASTGSTLTDSFTGPATLVSANSSNGTCTGTGPITCSIGSMTSGSTATITITLGTTAVGSVSNSASISTTQFDPNAANDSATAATISVTSSSDLTFGVSGPATAPMTSPVAYSVNVSNNGPDASGSYSVGLNLSGGTITSITGALTCSQTATTATCSGASLASGSAAAMTVNTTAGSGTSMILSGSVSYGSDPNSGNNGPFSHTTSLTPAADLAVVQTAPASVLNGQNGTWTITVTNNGPSSATGVTLSDAFTNATFVSATSTIGTCSSATAGPVTCSIGTLASGTAATVTLSLKAFATGTIASNATVSGTLYDSVTSNNSSSTSTTVNSASDLSVAVTGSPNPANVASTVTFTTTVKNNGPDAAGSYSVSLPLTGGTINGVSGSGLTCTWNPGTGVATCTGSSLASGSTAVITLTATATTPGTMTLGATSSYASDTNGANNSASANVVVNAAIDLGVTQSATPNPVFNGQTIVVTLPIGNSGPSPATGVTLSDTFTGATLVSASASQGGCSGTTTIICTLGTLAAGANAQVALTLRAAGVGTIASNATVTGNELDTNNTNNTSSISITSKAASDLTIAASHTPEPAPVGSTVTYSVAIKNLGPDAATAFSLNLSINGGDISSISGAGITCSGTTTSKACSGGSLASGATATLTVQVAVTGTPSSLNAFVSSASDPNSGNNGVTDGVNILTAADLSITKSGPSTAAFGDTVTYTITVNNAGPITANNVIVVDPTPAGLTLVSVSGACSALPCDLGTVSNGGTAVVTAKYIVNSNAPASVTNTAVVGSSTTDSTSANNTAAATTSITGCSAAPAQLLAPIRGERVSSPVAFSWTPVTGASQYEVFQVASTGNVRLGTVAAPATTLTANVITGPLTWYVVATLPCGTVQSANATANACNAPIAPTPSVVANASSGQSYDVTWSSVADAATYEVQESRDEAFTSPATQSVTGTTVTFTHAETTAPGAYFYRVRGVSVCDPQLKGAYSPVIRIVVAPIVAGTAPSASVPAGSTQVVIQEVFIPGLPDGNYLYVGSVDKPWMTLEHPTGTLTPAGVTLRVLADPATLPNGTFTATIILTLTPVSTTSSGARTNGGTTISVPVSVNLVTPVTPTSKTTTATNALIIPSVGHLDGINSQWRSDIRLANVGFSKQQYSLTFTPTAATSTATTGTVKTTTITVDAGATTALDDIVRNWYGVGSLGEASNGVLEIHPLSVGANSVAGDNAVATPPPGVSLTTVVSSRTYNASTAGTLGQYIPAIPFTSFIGRAAQGALSTVLNLQQVAQSDAYRTNVGVVEGAGAPASVTLSIYDDAGKKLTDYAMTLNPYQQVQLNSFLSTQGITLADGRIEVKVTGGDGKVTAYASVVDNRTNDPLLVSGVPVGQAATNRYVLPGVAALNNGVANWQTDMRIFNSGAAPQSATLSLYPLNGGTPLTASTTINPNEVKLLDSVVQSLFNQSNLGGALHITTSSDSNLLVTGRTYNQTAAGTYGQFVPAVTLNDAVGAGGRALNILQVEDSPRYRTNLGIAEVSGNPATVQIMVFLPDSKVTPKIEIPLGAFEYRQFPIIQSLGLGNIYNARISVQVISGSGKITAYGSVIDQVTQDPTYVPAQ